MRNVDELAVETFTDPFADHRFVDHPALDHTALDHQGLYRHEIKQHAWEPEWDRVPDWDCVPEPEWFGSVGTGVQPTRMSSPLDAIDFAINDAERARHETNRSMAARLAALAEVLRLARANPSVYLTEVGFRENDAVELAERSAAFDAARRLNVSPDQVRNQAHEGQVLADRLPRLWALFESGIIGYTQASAAVTHQIGLTDEAVARYDRELATKAPGQTDVAFRQKARSLRHTLLAEPPVLRHARALVDRRVSVEPADDGMAWLHAFISAPDAIRIKTRLDATAKRDITAEKAAATKAGLPLDGCRTRPQARADLLVAWLAGDGTRNAAKVRPMLFVPLLGLLGSDPSTSNGTGTGTGSTLQPAMLQGYGPIDPVTAAQLFSDAPSFRRVGTDPFTGEILNFDRRRYRPTKAQRELLAVKYGTCATPGCDRLATSSDVDHVAEWARDHGLTNQDNLIPLCAPDHRLKTLTKIRYTRDPDGSVTVTTPTGYRGRNTPAPPLPENPPF